jgi:hypothetical protein
MERYLKDEQQVGEIDSDQKEVSRCVETKLLAISSVRKASSNIFFGKIRKIFENFLVGHATCEVRKHVIHGNPHSTNAGLPTTLPGLKSYDL